MEDLGSEADPNEAIQTCVYTVGKTGDRIGRKRYDIAIADSVAECANPEFA
jgi:hypothetical protein